MRKKRVPVVFERWDESNDRLRNTRGCLVGESSDGTGGSEEGAVVESKLGIAARAPGAAGAGRGEDASEDGASLACGGGDVVGVRDATASGRRTRRRPRRLRTPRSMLGREVVSDVGTYDVGT